MNTGLTPRCKTDCPPENRVHPKFTSTKSSLGAKSLAQLPAPPQAADQARDKGPKMLIMNEIQCKEFSLRIVLPKRTPSLHNIARENSHRSHRAPSPHRWMVHRLLRATGFNACTQQSRGGDRQRWRPSLRDPKRRRYHRHVAVDRCRHPHRARPNLASPHSQSLGTPERNQHLIRNSIPRFQ